jgi:hypothetical protein
MNSYSVTLDYSQYLVQHSMNDPEGKKTTIRRYLVSDTYRYIPGINYCLEKFYKTGPRS